MQLSSFLPPRRTWDRVAAELYYRRHPDQPWLPRQAIKLLAGLLKPTDRCFEWGSGGSTTWLSTRVHSVCSIEHDRAWYDRIQVQLKGAGTNGTHVQLLSLEPHEKPQAAPYVRAIDEFGDGQLDVCFIDGEHRAWCALAVPPKLVSGGLLIVDDAQQYVDHPTSSPHSRHGKGPPDEQWRQFAALVDRWRLVWVSDGYSDTAIWIKP